MASLNTKVSVGMPLGGGAALLFAPQTSAALARMRAEVGSMAGATFGPGALVGPSLISGQVRLYEDLGLSGLAQRVHAFCTRKMFGEAADCLVEAAGAARCGNEDERLSGIELTLLGAMTAFVEASASNGLSGYRDNHDVVSAAVRSFAGNVFGRFKPLTTLRSLEVLETMNAMTRVLELINPARGRISSSAEIERRFRQSRRGAVLPPTLSEYPRDSTPIKEEDVNRCLRFFDGCQPSSRPGERAIIDGLMANVRFIGEKQFRTAIRKMRRDVEKFVGTGSYALVSDSAQDKSEAFIFEQLGLERGPIARYDFAGSHISPDHDKYVLVDDVAISGSYLTYRLKALFWESNIPPEKVIVAFVGMSERALNIAMRQFGAINVSVSFLLPLLSDIFTLEDIRTIRKISKEVADDDPATITACTLTFLYYKVSDFFLRMFAKREGGNSFYLVDAGIGGVYPPYKLRHR